MTLEELLAEQGKMKSRKITSAVFIGFLVGIAVYAAVKGKFLLTVILIGFAYWMGSRQTQQEKALQAEISRRENG